MTEASTFVETGVAILNSESVIGWVGEIPSTIVNDICDNCCVAKHSIRRGYIPIASTLVCAYNGEYGRGYTVHYPSKQINSTECHEVYYFIRREVICYEEQ